MSSYRLLVAFRRSPATDTRSRGNRRWTPVTTDSVRRDGNLHYTRRGSGPSHGAPAMDRARSPVAERLLRSGHAHPAAVAQRGRDQPARLAGRHQPELVGGAGDADVEHVAGPALIGVARGVDVDHDDVVELEALDLGDVGDVDPGLEVELVAADPAQRGDLGVAQALEVGVG